MEHPFTDFQLLHLSSLWVDQLYFFDKEVAKRAGLASHRLWFFHSFRGPSEHVDFQFPAGLFGS